MIRRGQRLGGAAAIEFALLLPVLVLLAMGIVEYGWMLYERSECTRAVREGVRYAVVMPSSGTPDPATIAKTRATTVLAGLGIDTTDATFTTKYDDLTKDAKATNDTLTLRLKLRYRPVTGGLVPTPSNLQVSMSMMLQDGT